MKPFEEEMCRNCSEYEYSDDCKQCELDWYKEKYKKLLERSDNSECTALAEASAQICACDGIETSPIHPRSVINNWKYCPYCGRKLRTFANVVGNKL